MLNYIQTHILTLDIKHIEKSYSNYSNYSMQCGWYVECVQVCRINTLVQCLWAKLTFS